MDEEKTLYSAYAGLSRTAMIWGVPLMAALGVFVCSVFASLLGAAMYGIGGLLFAFPGVPVMIFFKHICETDDQALRILWLEVVCFLHRANAGLFGKTYTLAPMTYGRSLKGYMDALERPQSLVLLEQLQERLLASGKDEESVNG
ncbi:type IV secretion system protein VirB3 [Paraburkholderia sp. GAS33]|uniref:VirB3 family type IV secretion system protein n=1 Tax=Paraburkholderia sp. GAS33 TaxID=3035130 RepID=UPI003D22A9D4